MGLCKCPKKNVTNLFCFEHRANVCLHCIVEDHQKCIVQSYLQWLNDSNYSPVCQLCKELLVNSDCVRLICYDVFHVHCLDNWAKNYSPNTAPAGYRCPICTSAVFPPSNNTTPVADTLRHVLSSFQWARAGLGMPLVTYQNTISDTVSSRSLTTSNEKQSSYGSTEMHRGSPDGRDVSSIPETFDPPTTHWAENVSVSRKHPDTSLLIGPTDETEDKYKRKPPFDWLNRWLRKVQRPSSRHHQGIIGRKRNMLLIIMVLAVILLFALLYYGRSEAYNDPMLDPQNNPNIHVED